MYFTSTESIVPNQFIKSKREQKKGIEMKKLSLDVNRYSGSYEEFSIADVLLSISCGMNLLAAKSQFYTPYAIENTKRSEFGGSEC